MLDFTNYLFRASGNGNIMTGFNADLTDNQNAEIKRLLEKQSIGKITQKQTITLGVLLEKKHTPKELAKGVKTYLQEIHKEEILKRRQDLKSKYLDKGIQGEEKSITLYSNVTGKLYLKNKIRYNNDFFTGEPDNVQGKIRDIKTSWDYSTFPMYDDEITNKMYLYQLNTYMDLTGMDEAELIYCLIDTPKKIIDDELRRLDWRENIVTQEGTIREKHIPLVVETISNLLYTDQGLKEYCALSSNVKIEWFDGFREIPEKLRIKVFETKKDEVLIENMKKQVIECRKYLNQLTDKIIIKLEI